MNTQAIHIAIAESMGWTEIKKTKWRDPFGLPPKGSVIFLPSYTTDLNACREFEMHMRGTDEQYFNDVERHRAFKHYQHILLNLYGPCATAAQRAEAYLKTIGKWVTN